MAVKLSALIKRTEASIASETDPKKRASLQASLAAFVATRAEMGDDDDGDKPAKKDGDDDGDGDGLVFHHVHHERGEHGEPAGRQAHGRGGGRDRERRSVRERSTAAGHTVGRRGRPVHAVGRDDHVERAARHVGRGGHA